MVNTFISALKVSNLSISEFLDITIINNNIKSKKHDINFVSLIRPCLSNNKYILPNKLLINEFKKIKENNILYDEDSDGSFFQIYTTLINNSFFLEFVQRNKSYDGYGANNAIFRISAQKKLIYGCHTW